MGRFYGCFYSNENAVTIARLLRHKSWKSTQKYVHTIEFKEEDFEETTATTLDEIRALGKAAWTKYDEANFNGVVYHFYRKPKRFGSLRNMKDKSQTYGISNYNS